MGPRQNTSLLRSMGTGALRTAIADLARKRESKAAEARRAARSARCSAAVEASRGGCYGKTGGGGGWRQGAATAGGGGRRLRWLRRAQPRSCRWWRECRWRRWWRRRGRRWRRERQVVANRLSVLGWHTLGRGARSRVGVACGRSPVSCRDTQILVGAE